MKPSNRHGNQFEHRWSLRVRFLLIAGACLLPLLGVTIYVLSQSLEHSRAQLLNAEVATAEVVAQVLRATLDDNGRMLIELANTERIRQLDATRSRAVLDEFKRARPSVYALFLLDAERDLIDFAGLDPSILTNTSSFNAAIDQAMLGEEFGVSNRLTTDDGPLFAIVAPVWAQEQEDGQPVGVVGALLSADRIKDTVLPFARGETVIAIFTENEVLAAQAPGMEESETADRLALPIGDAVGGLAGTYSFVDESGAERLAAVEPVPLTGANWAVLVTQPSPLTYGPNRALLIRGVSALALAVAATLILTLTLGEWVARPIRQLTAHAFAIARGDFGQRAAPSGGGEITALGVAFTEMSDRLQSQVHDLELAREAGAAHAEQMRELNRRTVRLQEDERRRISGDIHDAVAPLITGALYQTRALRLGPAGSSEVTASSNGDTAIADLDAIADLLTRAMEELHHVIFALRPPDLDDLGVVAAIERYINQVERSGLKCRLELIGEPPTLMPEVRLAVYRIVQEALHNALRHAAADQAVVQLETNDETLRVIIRDNGAGFNPESAARPSALGLLSMRERAAAIGAAFAVSSRPGDGTTIVIERRMEAEQLEETGTITVVVKPDGVEDHLVQAAPV
ncbi:MAG: HAMP domain-containing protein [Chloroflexia bacterium]|nr:HAMP domain-containing protein [Chloroflexia bacterium]